MTKAAQMVYSLDVLWTKNLYFKGINYRIKSIFKEDECEKVALVTVIAALSGFYSRMRAFAWICRLILGRNHRWNSRNLGYAVLANGDHFVPLDKLGDRR